MYFKADLNGFVMWKFMLRRDDSEPAPWTKEGRKFMQSMSVGHLEVMRLSNRKNTTG
jgi:hypothetical protein